MTFLQQVTDAFSKRFRRIVRVPDRVDACRRRPENFSVRNVSLCVNLNQCDLQCVMCWTLPDRERQRRGILPTSPMNMPRDRLIGLLRSPEMQEIETISVVGGGEPFVYPFIDDLLREGPTVTRRLMIMTHGGLIDRRPALWEAAMSSAITLTFSVDAATEATYAGIRKGGNWNQLMANMERFAEACRSNPLARLNASFVVLERNLEEVIPFLELCVRWGAHYVHFHPAIEGEYPADWRVDRTGERYLAVMRQAFHHAREHGIALDTPEELLTSPSLIAGGHPGGMPSEGVLDPRKTCQLHTNAMTISHLGEVFVCDTAFRVGYSCGNVFRDGVTGAWNSRAWHSLRRAHRIDRPERSALCSKCLLLR